MQDYHQETCFNHYLLYYCVLSPNYLFLWCHSIKTTLHTESETNRPVVVSSLHENARPRTSQDLVTFFSSLGYKFSDSICEIDIVICRTYRVRRLARPLNTPSPRWLIEFSPRLRLSRRPNPTKAVSSSLVR